MVVDFISLAVIVVVAALCPIIASLIPNKLIPESVFLLIAGAVLGPNLLGVIQTTDVVNFLSELGLAYLFLLAGMEINPKNLVGHEGKRGIGAWGISLALGFVVVFLLPWFDPAQLDGIAVAIAMTTTAFGTLVPIMKERGLTGTPVGNSIMAYGTWGELAPIVAIALLLSTRSSWQTLLILGAFALIAVVMAFIPKKAKAAGSKIAHFVQTRSNTTYQTMVRFTMLRILVLLLAISEIFHLDIVLGAFAAGFVMGAIIPEGDEELETKLNGAAYGFFIPLFFIVSGAKVNILAIGDNPVLLVVFIIALMMVRGIPVFIMLTTDKRCELSAHNRWTVALYCTTALPLVVAITSIGTSMGFFSQDTASVLVAAGAITVFLMPFLASLTYRVADAMPGEAIKEIRENPSDIGRIDPPPCHARAAREPRDGSRPPRAAQEADRRAGRLMRHQRVQEGLQAPCHTRGRAEEHRRGARPARRAARRRLAARGPAGAAQPAPRGAEAPPHAHVRGRDRGKPQPGGREPRAHRHHRITQAPRRDLPQGSLAQRKRSRRERPRRGSARLTPPTPRQRQLKTSEPEQYKRGRGNPRPLEAYRQRFARAYSVSP